MKKLLSILLILSLFIFFSACQSTVNNPENDMEIGLVIGISGIDDGSFNQNAWEAIQKFAAEKNLASDNIYYTHSNETEDLVSNLSTYADKKPAVIVAPGYYFVDPLKVISKKYPEQKFILVDAAVDCPNVVSITFANNEGSFLAGLSAAMKATSDGKNKVGFLGGADIPLIQSFETGFIHGVLTVDPELDIIVRYAKDFANPIAGKRIANEMYDEGAYVIYHAAGDTGNGLIEAARERALNGEKIWVIGVDKDQYQSGIYEDGKSVILTSMLKRTDVAVYDMLEGIANDSFKAGHVVYGLENNGVGLPKENPNLSSEQIEKIQEYRQKVIDKEIIVPINLK